MSDTYYEPVELADPFNPYVPTIHREKAAGPEKIANDLTTKPERKKAKKGKSALDLIKAKRQEERSYQQQLMDRTIYTSVLGRRVKGDLPPLTGTPRLPDGRYPLAISTNDITQGELDYYFRVMPKVLEQKMKELEQEIELESKKDWERPARPAKSVTTTRE